MFSLMRVKQLLMHKVNQSDEMWHELRCLMLRLCTILFRKTYIEGILPKGTYPPCLRMADKALLAGYPRYNRPLSDNPFKEHLFVRHTHYCLLLAFCIQICLLRCASIHNLHRPYQ